MRFIKHNFMDIEMDVLVGHPEHEVLFIASQVARAAGLEKPSTAIWSFRKQAKNPPKVVLMGELPALEAPPEVYNNIVELETPGTEVYNNIVDLPKDPSGRRYQGKTVLMSEGDCYQMLLRGNAPESESFLKWVTEEVLPALRKAGAYSMHDSEEPKFIQLTDEFAALAEAMVRTIEKDLTTRVETIMERIMAHNLPPREELKEEIRGKALNTSQDIGDEPDSLHFPVPAREMSPYYGTTIVHLADGILFDPRTYYDVGSILGLNRQALDKLKPYVLLSADKTLNRLWSVEDGRTLKTYVSDAKQKWNMYPKEWAEAKLNRLFYRDVTAASTNEILVKLLKPERNNDGFL